MVRVSTYSLTILFLSWGVFSLQLRIWGEQDKSGVKPSVLSLPSGPGSIEGLGESFEPQLNNGTSSYEIKLVVPPGRAGFVPELSLTYNSGKGNGPFGLGWDISLPYLQRQTDKGLPLYVDRDQFTGDSFFSKTEGEFDTIIFSNGEELVAIEDGFYRCENENDFSKFSRNGEGWIAVRRDGVQMSFGTVPEARIEDGGTRIFKWLLESMMDTNGNTISFYYIQKDDSHQRYCSRIEYNFSAKGTMAIAFDYGDAIRPDVVTDFRPRFELKTAFRCLAIRMLQDNHLIREYCLGYLETGANSPMSLLASVVHRGSDNLSELPPALFSYVAFKGQTAQYAAMPTAPRNDLKGGNIDLMDINADGLPDILDTTDAPDHLAYMNLGPDATGQVCWTLSPEPLQATKPIYLGSSDVQLADMEGNGCVKMLELYSREVQTYRIIQVNQEFRWEPERLIANADFLLSDPNVRMVDLNSDKLTDVMRTESGNAFVWLNLKDGNWQAASITTLPNASLQFDRNYTRLADMNGDRIQDLVWLEEDICSYWPGMGFGEFASEIEMTNSPGTINDPAGLQLADVNGDGLSDVIYVEGALVKVWINLGLLPTDHSQGHFAIPFSVTGPPANSSTVFRQCDINGNGSTDILWNTCPGGGNETYAYLDFCPEEQPYQLKTITNGIGLTTTISYSSSVDEMVRAREAGVPWTQWTPFPVPVVTRIEAFDGVNPPYITEIEYRNPYYDGEEREFRGFASATRRELGDTTLPDLYTDHLFDTGIEHDVLKGKTLSFEARGEAKSGEDVFYREELAWEARKLLDGASGETRTVNFAAQTARERTVTEQGRGTPVTLRWEYDYDNYGNTIYQKEFGRLDGAWDDERVTETVYTAADVSGLNAWMLDKVVIQTTSDENGVMVAQKRNYYDDQPLGQVGARGNLTKVEDWIDGTHYAATTHNAFDDYGNIIRIEDALYGTEPGHYRELVYDDVFHTFPVKEIIHTGNSMSPLVMTATYDYGFGVMTASTEFNGFTTTYDYDTFGRLTSITKPPDAGHTVEYDYVLAYDLGGGHVINWVETRQRNSGSPDGWLHSRAYHDGLDRKVMTRTDGEDAGQVVVSDTVIFNARKQPWKKYLPYFEAGGLDYVDPGYNSGCTTHYYDALSREIRMDQPDGTWSETLYAPLEKTVYDEEQTNSASPHYQCGMRYVEDGLQDKDGKGRLREVYEIVKLTPAGDPGALTAWPTRYTYNLLDNFTGYTDSLGNQKLVEYDGLGRKTFMNDPDRGHMYYEYDDAGNLVHTTDAKGQVIRYDYDGANRLLAEYYGTDTAVPDVEYHYDMAAGPVALGEFWVATPEQEVAEAILGGAPTASLDLDWNKDNKIDVADAVMVARAGENKSQPTKTATNVRGYLAWVKDQSGEEHNAYDARGRVAWTVKRIQDTGPEDLKNFYTGYDYDSMDRVTMLTYPDQTTVNYTYNARGLLEAIPNVVTCADYNPAGQNARLDYACGTSTTYDYDNRLRLKRLRTVRDQDKVNLQDLNYTYDGVSNITAITDGRSENDYQTIGEELGISLTESKKFDNTQSFGYDSLYRLTQSSNPTVYGTITHRYDPIGNMVYQNADLLEPDPLMNLVTMTSGGTGGTSNRIGRGPAAPPGPHAITSTEKGPDGAMMFAYDANGNMTKDCDMEMRWDYKDRLKGITKGTTVANYLYDYADTRKKKSIQGEPGKTVFYVDKNSEVREDRLLKYVYAGTKHSARMDSDFILQASDFGFHPSGFYLHDHLGSTTFALRGITASSEQQMINYSYGRTRIEHSKPDTRQNALYKFTGKERDTESALKYFQSRFLSESAAGKFISVDSAIMLLTESGFRDNGEKEALPKKINPYAYCNNSPIGYIDPDGFDSVTCQVLFTASKGEGSYGGGVRFGANDTNGGFFQIQGKAPLLKTWGDVATSSGDKKMSFHIPEISVDTKLGKFSSAIAIEPESREVIAKTRASISLGVLDLGVGVNIPVAGEKAKNIANTGEAVFSITDSGRLGFKIGPTKAKLSFGCEFAVSNQGLDKAVNSPPPSLSPGEQKKAQQVQ